MIKELLADGSIYNFDCTGDVVAGDEIKFTEAVFGGSFKKPRYLGDRTICALVTNDSYGAKKQQHTFTLKILASNGISPLEAGTKTTRKGRNVYRNGTLRRPWIDPELREMAVEEKHFRGDQARAFRSYRRNEGWQELNIYI